MQYADVAVHSRVGQRNATFTYAIAPELLPELTLGGVVEVPFRSRRTLGIVTQLRRQLPRGVDRARLRDIRRVVSHWPLLSADELRLRRHIAKQLHQPESLVMTLLLPPLAILKDERPPAMTRAAPASRPIYRLGLAMADQDYFMASIRATLKNDQSVIITVPTRRDLERWQTALSAAGLAASLAVYHPQAPANEQLPAWDIVLGRRTGIVIGMRSAVFLPVRQLGLQIIDQALHHQLHEEQAPRSHALAVARWRQHVSGGQLIAYTALPPLTALAAPERRTWEFRRVGTGPRTISVVHRNPREKVSKITLATLTEYLKRGKTALVVTPQRGWAHGLACRACDLILRCPDCDRVLAQEQSGAILCKSCTKTLPATTCPRCDSSRLAPFGWGSALWTSYFTEQLPGTPVQELADSPALASGILTITAPIFDTLAPLPVDLVVVLAPEKLRKANDYQATERWLQLLWMLRAMARDRLLIETETPDDAVLAELTDSLPRIALGAELALRKQHGYPPFAPDA